MTHAEVLSLKPGDRVYDSCGTTMVVHSVRMGPLHSWMFTVAKGSAVIDGLTLAEVLERDCRLEYLSLAEALSMTLTRPQVASLTITAHGDELGERYYTVKEYVMDGTGCLMRRDDISPQANESRYTDANLVDVLAKYPELWDARWNLGVLCNLSTATKSGMAVTMLRDVLANASVTWD